MTISPWLTFESIKDLQTQVSSLENGGLDFINITSAFQTLPINDASEAVAIGDGAIIINLGQSGISIMGGVFAPRAIAIGDGCAVTGSNGVAVGDDASAGTDAVAVGANTQANASNSIAIGEDAEANATQATQIGAGTNSTASTLQFLTVPIANSTGLLIPGPFADDTAAAGGGVGIGNPYYTAAGDMKVRLT